jgi:hypothetical protein
MASIHAAQYYLDILSKWPSSIAIASQFLVYFNLKSVRALNKNVSQFAATTISSLDSSEWSVNKKTIEGLLDDKFHNVDARVGCVFAREVSIPQESNNINRNGLSYGAHLAPITVENRKSSHTFDCKFLETNASFVDLIVRPWCILAGHYGMVARNPLSNKNIKCDYVDIVQYGKSGYSSAPYIRKIIRFQNVVPMSIGGYTVSHTEDGLSVRNASFAFNNYSILEMSTKTLIDK